MPKPTNKQPSMPPLLSNPFEPPSKPRPLPKQPKVNKAPGARRTIRAQSQDSQLVGRYTHGKNAASFDASVPGRTSQGSRTDRTRQAAPTADHGRARKGHRVDLLSDGSGDRIDSIDKLDNIMPGVHHVGPYESCDQPGKDKRRRPIDAFEDIHGFTHTPETDTERDELLEAWGIQGPEPWEEFSGAATRTHLGGTPASSIYAGREGRISRSATPQHSIGRRANGRDLHGVFKEYLNGDRKTVPPVKPILHLLERDPYSHSDTECDTRPRRSKSLKQCIQLFRRPGTAGSPGSPREERAHGYVYISRREREKPLPSPPEDRHGRRATISTPTPSSQNRSDTLDISRGANLGRKTSLLQKVKGVVLPK